MTTKYCMRGEISFKKSSMESVGELVPLFLKIRNIATENSDNQKCVLFRCDVQHRAWNPFVHNIEIPGSRRGAPRNDVPHFAPGLPACPASFFRDRPAARDR